MPDYSTGKIYKIVADNGIYVGSTTRTLHRRFRKHINQQKQTRKCYSSKLNLDTAEIILLENYPCKSRNQLLWKEREWMEKIECVNKERPIITDEERKEYQKQRAQKNKPQYNEWRKGRRHYQNSWGFNNYLGTSLNLLDIDTTLFQ
tara:strand:+ start:43 stop:483 length:441 start_codon:yes stop_codon:yes gene_type:complete